VTARAGRLLLAIDTATRESIVALGSLDPGPASDVVGGELGAPTSDGLVAESRRSVQHRHGSQLLEQLGEVLSAAATSLDAVGAIAVGTGPGSFTGLRVGVATAKTLAHVRRLLLVGVPTSEALRRAAVAAGAPPGSAVVLPAGAHDHYLARADGPAELVAPGGLVEALGATPAISVDLDTFGDDASRRGGIAVDGLPGALLALARERLTAGQSDDVALLVPAYVALPRGVASATQELAWSPDLR